MSAPRINASAIPCSNSALWIFLALAFFLSACSEIKQPVAEPLVSDTQVPTVQEFRWSNGGRPKSLDPALATAPPETDIVRALFEGLTEIDPKTLDATPALAESWQSSNGFREWTFRLRKDARWTNGKAVTAGDFVRSWRRLVRLGEKTAHRELLLNIEGAVPQKDEDLVAPGSDIFVDPARQKPTVQQTSPPSNTQNSNGSREPSPVKKESVAETNLGVVATGEFTLTVKLTYPDAEFPKLVANPIFRPVYGDGREFADKSETGTALVTNGAYKLSSISTEGTTLTKSETYWNNQSVKLPKVRFIEKKSMEETLTAYRAGQIDAITNSAFSPLVLKLLAPYEDFRKTPHAALNFFEVNVNRQPFSDRRVRQALSGAIEREKLTGEELDGAAVPAYGFMPFSTKPRMRLNQDRDMAKSLLDEAGFPDGIGFPILRLVVNRNETQQRVARSVARMWRQTLNIETEIVVKDTSEIENIRESGDFDLVRRGIVFPSSDASANLMLVFGRPPVDSTRSDSTAASRGDEPAPNNNSNSNANVGRNDDSGDNEFSEELSLHELRAIPLYFPASYSLVRPYVKGFETNSLDAHILTSVSIDENWRPAK